MQDQQKLFKWIAAVINARSAKTVIEACCRHKMQNQQKLFKWLAAVINCFGGVLNDQENLYLDELRASHT